MCVVCLFVYAQEAISNDNFDRKINRGRKGEGRWTAFGNEMNEKEEWNAYECCNSEIITSRNLNLQVAWSWLAKVKMNVSAKFIKIGEKITEVAWKDEEIIIKELNSSESWEKQIYAKHNVSIPFQD